MATNLSLCTICDLRHLPTSSTHWCQECEEAFCIDCKEHHNLSKVSRDHHFITLSEYNNLPNFISNIDLYCTDHHEKYVQYCTKHKCPICFKFVKGHGKCGELTLLEEFVCDVKYSDSFREMKQSLEDIIVNIDNIRKDRKSNIEIILNEKKQITKEVSRLKAKITQHLDKLQENFLNELDKVETECCSNINSIILALNDQDQEMHRCNTEMENLKSYASDIQTFLGMREIQKKITQNEKSIHSMFNKKMTEEVSLESTIDSEMQNVCTYVKKYGSIKIKRCESGCIKLVKKKTGQDQILVTKKVQSVKNINLDCKKKLKTTCNKIKSCGVTCKGDYIFIDNKDNKDSYKQLVALNANGKTEYTVPLARNPETFDLVCIDDYTVVHTIGCTGFGRVGILIIDLTTRTVKHWVDLPNRSYGITFDGKSILCCCADNEIIFISCTDYSKTTIPNTVMSAFSHITSYDNKIFYTNPYENKVYCCLYNGELVWEFKKETILKKPRGITVDDKGIIFVLEMGYNSVVVISPNGKHYKQIQIDQFDIPKPSSIYFDKFKKQILLTNEDNFANLYDISYF